MQGEDSGEEVGEEDRGEEVGEDRGEEVGEDRGEEMEVEDLEGEEGGGPALQWLGGGAGLRESRREP